MGFAVGSSGDDEADDTPAMEGSGLQEDEWTEESASASPYSTRQNTANNSRRTSVVHDKPPDRRPLLDLGGGQNAQQLQGARSMALESTPEADGTPAQSYESDDEAVSPNSMPHPKQDSSRRAELDQWRIGAVEQRRSPLFLASCFLKVTMNSNVSVRSSNDGTSEDDFYDLLDEIIKIENPGPLMMWVMLFKCT